jgi:hypothetical protein
MIVITINLGGNEMEEKEKREEKMENKEEKKELEIGGDGDFCDGKLCVDDALIEGWLNSDDLFEILGDFTD